MNSPKAFLVIFALAVATATPFSSGQDRNRNWDPSDYLRKTDRNGNGMLEPVEVGDGRTAGFIRKLGFDTSKPIPLKKVVEKISNDRKQVEIKAANEKREAGRKVPGFGVDSELEPVPGFGVGDESVSPAPGDLKDRYSQSIMEQVERSLRRYDRNENGMLDKEEVERARWGNPTPKESDLNGDGRLSKAELAERYKRRDVDSYRSNNSASSSSSSTRSSERGSSNETRWRSSRSGDRPSSSSSKRESSSNDSKSESKSSRDSSSSKDDRIAAYVDDILGSYDKNLDGKIDAGELEKMKSPPKRADSDGDGVISKSELTSYYGGGYSSKPASKRSGNSDKSKFRSSREKEKKSRDRDRDSEKSSSSSSSSSKVSKPSFSSDDKNSDGQIQMHEFTSDWTVEKRDEFNKYDLNRDGIITKDEWSRSRK